MGRRGVTRGAREPRWIMKAQLLKRFEDEIGQLERELKTELPKEIQRARELGDLRENAEYKAAKERQEYVNARIGMLRKRVSEIYRRDPGLTTVFEELTALIELASCEAP